MEHNTSSTKEGPFPTNSKLSSEYDVHYLISMLQREEARPALKLRSPQLQHRAEVVLYLEDTCAGLLLASHFLHTAVWLLDVFMDNYTINDLRAVGLVCLHIAAKADGVRMTIPSYLEICLVGDAEPLEANRLSTMEFEILSNVNWKMMSPNVTTFLSFYKKYAITNEDMDTNKYRFKSPDSYPLLQKFFEEKYEKYLTVILKDITLCSLSPSLLAMACIMSARSCRGFRNWPEQYKNFSKHTREEINNVSLQLIEKMVMARVAPGLKRRCIVSLNNVPEVCPEASKPKRSRKQ